MNKFLIAATLSILGASAFAQAPSTPSASPVPSSASATSAAPAAAAPGTSADQHPQRAAGKFRKLDTNGDGALSREEAAARPGLTKNFDAIDNNKDGRLSPDELKAYAQARRSQHNTAPAKAS